MPPPVRHGLIAPVGAVEVTYTKTVEVLVKHFEPGESVILSRHRFDSCRRKESETISAFLSRFRHLARPCQFTCCAGILEEILRDRFVSGIRDERLQSRLLGGKKLTLEFGDSDCDRIRGISSASRRDLAGPGGSV